MTLSTSLPGSAIEPVVSTGPLELRVANVNSREMKKAPLARGLRHFDKEKDQGVVATQPEAAFDHSYW